MSYRKHYSFFFQNKPNLLHFAAHSHHPWPDVTRAAHLEYWNDAAKYIDEKWEKKIFCEVIPAAQRFVAEGIGWSSPGQICFAPNTHEFVVRLLSCFDQQKSLRVLTTDSEFHSFRRQIERLEEREEVTVTRISTEPFGTFSDRFIEEAQTSYDFVFFSHVFFNSGYIVSELTKILAAIPSAGTVTVVDGYHAFGAIPLDLSPFSSQIFYLGGSYKYLQGGEGACFLAVPAGCQLRPESTGWLATYGELEQIDSTSVNQVRYAENGFRFWGATFDPSGLYRFNAVQRWLRDVGLTASDIRAYVQELEQHFLDELETRKPECLSDAELVMDRLENQGSFLTYRFPQAQRVHEKLRERDVVTDVRHDRLRFGFGIYQSKDDVVDLVSRLAEI